MGIKDLGDYINRIRQNNISIAKQLHTNEPAVQLTENNKLQENSSMSVPVHSEFALSSFLAKNAIEKVKNDKEYVQNELSEALRTSNFYTKSLDNIGKDELETRLSEFVSEISKYITPDTDVDKFVSVLKNAINKNVLDLSGTKNINSLSEFLSSSRGLDSLRFLMAMSDDNHNITKVVDRDKISVEQLEFLKLKLHGYGLYSVYELADKIKANNAILENLKKYPELTKKGYTYASDNEYINQLYMQSDIVGDYGLIQLEKAIKTQCNYDSEKIKELSLRLSDAVKNASTWINCLNYDCSALDLDAVAKFGTELCSRFSDSGAYSIYLKDAFSSINDVNKPVVEDLLSVKNMDLRTFYHSLNYCDSPEKVAELRKTIDDVKSEKSSILELPYAKMAKINEDILKLKDSQYKTFEEGASLDEVSAQTEQGEIAYVGEKTFINNKGQMLEIKVKSDMFQKLFPPFETKVMQQGNRTTNCVFLSYDMIGLERNNHLRPKIYETIRQDGNDIVVTFPKYPNYPVRFKNGEPEQAPAEFQLMNTAKGNQLLEQAMLKVLYAVSNGIEDASAIPYEKVIENAPGGIDYYGIIAVPQNKQRHIDKDHWLDLLRKYSDKDNAVINAYSDSSTLIAITKKLTNMTLSTGMRSMFRVLMKKTER